MDIILVAYFVIIFFSIVVHEVSHGEAALILGDDTAKRLGRLSFNPIKHVDLVGTILVPAICLLLRSAGFGMLVFGWAKPVPINPINLKDPQKDLAKISFAGPLSNIMLALLVGILIRFSGFFNFSSIINQILVFTIYINLFLAFINLIPISPLDGSKILFYFLKNRQIEMFFHQYRFVLFFAIWFLITPIANITMFLTKLIAGI
jgi:Zn-dependent protease